MAKNTRPRLGRGLSSLIGEPTAIAVENDASSKPPAYAPSADAIVHIPVGEIRQNEHQPRTQFSDASLEELAASIRTKGVLQPVLVRPITKQLEDGSKWELIAGERRWRAAARAGLDAVPAIVRELSDQESGEWALIENVQREDLNPMERAWALRRLAEEFGISHSALAERVGLARASVTNLVRLTELEQAIQDLVHEGALSMGHARALLAMPAGPARTEMAAHTSQHGWSVRELERRVGSGGSEPGTREKNVPSNPQQKPANIEDLERQLADHLGTKVRIQLSKDGSRGKVIAEFFDLDHFDGLVRAMGFSRRS